MINVDTFDSGRSSIFEYTTYSEAKIVKFSVDPQILNLNAVKMSFNLSGGVDDFLTVKLNDFVIANNIFGYWSKCNSYCSADDKICRQQICYPDPVKTSPILPFSISISDKRILKENNTVKMFAVSPGGENWLIINSGTITISYYSE